MGVGERERGQGRRDVMGLERNLGPDYMGSCEGCGRQVLGFTLLSVDGTGWS